ncbi:MAG TPA: hypothetical protein VGP54_06810, partial [Gaiellaceae bacterium]|nr:hypothetical protein [Gaiellaceae bacterium]
RRRRPHAPDRDESRDQPNHEYAPPPAHKQILDTQHRAVNLGAGLGRREEILLGAGRRFRVLTVVPFEEEDESPFVGLLRVEAA